MKLLHITTVPQTLSFLSRLVRHMKSQGFEVHALSSPGERLARFGEDAQVEVHAVPMARRITPLRDLRALWRIRGVLSSVRPDIVHGHTPKGGLLAMIGAWLARVPVRIYHMYGLPLTTARGPRRLLLRWTERLSCRLAHQVLCLSRSLREVAVAEGLCPPQKIKVLLSGNIDGLDAEEKFNPARVAAGARADVRAQYGIPADAVVAGFVGRIVRDKGLCELAGAWQMLRKEFPHLHLLVVGTPEPQDPIPAEVDRLLHSDPRIHLTGWCRDTPRLYAAMDVFVLPTYREGFGTVSLEAAAMELPVVTSRVPGCIDAVQDGVTGTLVTVRDAAALAAGVRRYLSDPGLRRRHGLTGRQRVLRDFRPEAMAEALYQEYVRLLRDKGLVVPRPSALAAAPVGAVQAMRG